MKKIFSKMMNNIYNFIQKIGEDKFYKILLYTFLILALLPLLIPGIPGGHDIRFHLSRIEGITEELKNGTFPVLIYPGYIFGYGYANGCFYPDIFMYIPGILHLIGMSTINSYKILVALITVFSLVSMYFTISKITMSKSISTIISILYLMSSYRITDLWVRSAVGEALTFVFLPLVMLGMYEIIYGNVKNWKYLTFGLLGVVLSHLLSVIFCLIIVGFFTIMNIKKLLNNKKRLKYLMISGFLAIGISAFFTFPLLEMMMSDTYTYTLYSDSKFIAANSVFPLLTIIEFPSGLLPWIPQGIGVVFIYLYIKYYNVHIKDNNAKKFKNLCLLLGVILIFMTTSLFPWKLFGKVFGMLQFPWRFYTLITILLLIGFAVLMSYRKFDFKSNINNILILCVFALFTYSICTLYALRAGQINNTYKGTIIWGEYVPIDVDIDLYQQRGDIITSNNSIEYDFVRKGTSIMVDYSKNTYSDTYIELPLMYYKGYKAIEENSELLVEKGTNGLLRVYLNNVSGKMSIYYGFTTIRIIGYSITAISIIVYFTLKNKLKIN